MLEEACQGSLIVRKLEGDCEGLIQNNKIHSSQYLDELTARDKRRIVQEKKSLLLDNSFISGSLQ